LNYVPTSSFNSTLSSYTLSSTLTATLSYYVANSTLATTLSNYLTTSSASSTYLTIANMGSYAPITSPTLLGTPKSTTPSTSDNSTNIATTAFVTNVLTPIVTNINATNEVFNTRLNEIDTLDASFNTRITTLENKSTTNACQPIGVTVINSIADYIIAAPSTIYSPPYTHVYLITGNIYNVHLLKNTGNSSGQLNGTILKMRVDNLTTGYNFIFLKIYDGSNVFLINGSYTNQLTIYNNTCVEIAIYNTGFVFLR